MKYIITGILIIFSFTTIYSQVGTVVDDTITNYIDINKKKQGKWVKYYDNGQMRYKGYFINDLPTGTFTFYHTNGKIKSLLTYDDKGFSKTELFWENGNNAAKGSYNPDKKRVGEWEIYFEDGTLASIINYDDKGEADGEVIMYYPSSEDKVLHCFYKKGLKHGMYTKYFQNGRIQEQGMYKNNLKEGIWKLYSPTGALEEEANYVNGIKSGQCIIYTAETGIDTVNYVNGRPDNYDEKMQEWFEKEEWAKENQHLFKKPEDYLDNPFEFFKPSNITYPDGN